MTITVTEDDLRDFRAKMIEWCIARSKFYAEMHSKAVGFGSQREFIAEMEAWDKNNPPPNFFPRV